MSSAFTAANGDELHFDHPKPGVAFTARLQSIIPVDHLDLICNGKLVRALIRGKAVVHGDYSGTLDLRQSGWCLLRASTDGARYPVLDNYVYATTSPISRASTSFDARISVRVAEPVRPSATPRPATKRRYFAPPGLPARKSSSCPTVAPS